MTTEVDAPPLSSARNTLPSSDVTGYRELRERLQEYLPPEDLAHIDEAYQFACAAHKGQLRASGEPYITHPVAVTHIVADWHMDAQGVIAALLHDVMEDTAFGKQEISDRFGKNTAELVDGLSKLDKFEFRSKEEAQAENFRKMLLAMASDLRVILIKLADRLHNMRTLDIMRPSKRRRIADETLEIYAPIANRLGLNTLYQDLQELCFRHKYSFRYRVFCKAIQDTNANQQEIICTVIEAIKTQLPLWQITGVEIQGRGKNLYSIYRKMVEKHLSFSQVLDIYGFRVIVADVASCYLALGALHTIYKPIPGKFKDYIAIPKGNGYQSIHTSVIGPFGHPIEVQIRTAQMHHIAESGVASHWLYKDDEKTLTELQKKTHTWLQSLLELQSASGEATEFLEHVKIDLFPDEVYVFTPKGKILSLPRGSTPVDFAYAIHSDIGNTCVACKINGDLMPLRSELSNGDQVEIISATQNCPNPAWLSYVRTAKARSQIRHFLKNTQQEESISLGERLLNQCLNHHGLQYGEISSFAWDRFLRENSIRTKKEVLSEIGLGRKLPVIVARALVKAQEEQPEHLDIVRPKTDAAILIDGYEGTTVQLANCCQPIPGDPIIGIIRAGKGLEIHRADCIHTGRGRSDHSYWVDVAWGTDQRKLFDATIRILSREARGVLARVTSAIADTDSNIHNITMEHQETTHFALTVTIQVRDRVHLARVLRAIKRVPDVVRLGRVRSDGKVSSI